MEALLCPEIIPNIRSSIDDLSPSFEWPMKSLSSLAPMESSDKGDKDVDKPRCEWNLSLSAAIVASGSAKTAPSDAIGAIEFDSTGEILATGGISRKIRFYRMSSFPDSPTVVLDHGEVLQFCICTPAKLSSLRWRPDSSNRVIGSGDYDGVVTEYDAEKRVPVFERDEHGGRRVWSVDYTRYTGSVIGASGSDDGTVQMWDSRAAESGSAEPSKIRPGGGSAICSVEFDPTGGPSLAVGCADRCAYVYDIRRLVDPVVALEGHSKTVSYARFLDPRTVVTASTDGSLKTWDVSEGRRVVRTYRGHVNSRNFVGLSVWRHGGLLASGSEDDNVVVYDTRWGDPVWIHRFGVGSGHTGRVGTDRQFVSSVCWRQVGEDGCVLVAGGSDGVLEVFSGQHN
ncbi:PREDICTED: WD repeat-containing protein RUP1 isoform X2 [Tarenaya hassleriana]|uniref:WD repeat-containing protein RUP1 isoform X2 n=1 Tax=Tarenaya hassleriana TaxID=28532 RepID=UPI00053C8B8A|nr:PREDICTED: WD repeat-containing protein RUP1 isoform X2 [Tarenaya hassleriana]